VGLAVIPESRRRRLDHQRPASRGLDARPFHRCPGPGRPGADLPRPEARWQELESLEEEDQGCRLQNRQGDQEERRRQERKVVGQNKKPGTVLPASTVVKVTLGNG
jgi:hypothetical protein